MGGNNGKKSFFIFTFVSRIRFQTNGKKNPDIQNNLSRSPHNSGAFPVQAMEKVMGGWVGVGGVGGGAAAPCWSTEGKRELNDNGVSAI